jgi:hypothetical protein
MQRLQWPLYEDDRMWRTELYFNGCLPSFFLVLFSVGDSHSAGLLRFCLPLQQKGIEFDSNGIEIRLQFTKGAEPGSG